MKWRRPKPLIKVIQEFEKADSLPPHIQSELMDSDVDINEQALRGVFQNCSDVVFRSVVVNERMKMLLVYVDGLVDTTVVEQVVLKPFMFDGMPNGLENFRPIVDIMKQQLIASAQVKTAYNIADIVDGIMKANLAVLINDDSKAIMADLKGFEKRSVEEPTAEIAVRGPRDGFTEALRVNTTLVRRRIRSPRLKMESVTIGELSQTDVVLAYIDGIAPDTILDEVRQRVGRIQVDAVLESGFIEEFVEDHPFSPFPTVQNTERPDVVCANLLEGKVAIMVDNTPFSLIVPFTFWGAFQAAEDYYERSVYSTFIRWIRFTLFNVSLFLPSLFVAITTFHPQLIPTGLLISIAAAREGIPFPAVVETFLMEFMFEGLREAGIRLPKPVGSAVSIVGALVIGQAAVQAGIISAPVVIIVATTGIASFAIPRYNVGTAYRMLRFPMLLVAGMYGLYGVAIGAIVILIHLCSLRSFGVPYLSPVTPQLPGDLKDIFIRAPRWNMTHRPALVTGENKERTPQGQQPGPTRGQRKS